MEKSNIDLIEWNRWFNKFIHPVFTIEGIDAYYDYLKKIDAPFYPKDWIAKKFYETIKNDSRFDEELKLFFSFLYSCGFFMENIITFENWITLDNWSNPHDEKVVEKPILKILEGPNGISVLKNKLRWLPFLSRPEGF